MTNYIDEFGTEQMLKPYDITGCNFRTRAAITSTSPIDILISLDDLVSQTFRSAPIFHIYIFRNRSVCRTKIRAGSFVRSQSHK